MYIIDPNPATISSVFQSIQIEHTVEIAAEQPGMVRAARPISQLTQYICDGKVYVFVTIHMAFT